MPRHAMPHTIRNVTHAQDQEHPKYRPLAVTRRAGGTHTGKGKTLCYQQELGSAISGPKIAPRWLETTIATRDGRQRRPQDDTPQMAPRWLPMDTQDGPKMAPP